MVNISQVAAVLFDIDGVLADTKEMIINTWKIYFEKYKVDIHKDKMESLLLGVIKYDELKNAIIEGSLINVDPKLIIEEAEKHYRSMVFLKIKPVNGLLTFLKSLKNKTVKMAVTTSASRMTMNAVIDALKIHAYFDDLFCGDDVKRRKPDPEIFQLASDMLKISPNRCLVFEDSPDGIKAAKSIGMSCIAISTTFSTEKLGEADYIISSYEEFPWELISFK